MEFHPPVTLSETNLLWGGKWVWVRVRVRNFAHWKSLHHVYQMICEWWQTRKHTLATESRLWFFSVTELKAGYIFCWLLSTKQILFWVIARTSSKSHKNGGFCVLNHYSLGPLRDHSLRFPQYRNPTFHPTIHPTFLSVSPYSNRDH